MWKLRSVGSPLCRGSSRIRQCSRIDAYTGQRVAHIHPNLRRVRVFRKRDDHKDAKESNIFSLIVGEGLKSPMWYCRRQQTHLCRLLHRVRVYVQRDNHTEFPRVHRHICSCSHRCLWSKFDLQQRHYVINQQLW